MNSSIFFFTGTFFFNVTNDISCSTTLSYYQIKQAISVLEKWGIIKVVLKGVPAKKHFKIDHSQILNFLTSSIEKTEELDCKNFNNKMLNNSSSINNNKEIIIKNKKVNTRKEKSNLIGSLTAKDFMVAAAHTIAIELGHKELLEDFVDARAVTSSTNYSNLTNIPGGIFSGSFTAGPNITINQSGQNIIISGSATSNYTNLSNIPSNIVSSSLQFTNLSSSFLEPKIFTNSS